MNTSRYSLGLTCLAATLMLVFAVQPVSAQEGEPAKVKKEIKVLVDDDGNVTVNGKPVTEDKVELDDGTVVMVDEDGKVVVVGEDEVGERIIRRRKMMAPEAGPHVRVWRMKDGDDDFEWHGRLGMDAHEALDHARHMRLEGMLGEDFDFEFDFDHVNPEIMEMEAATRKVAREASRAQGDEKAQKERELSDKLARLFDKKIEMRQKHIAHLAERLEKERSELKERQGARSEIIERRKAELLGDDTLKW